jgi:hypothetical protein
MIYQFEYGEIEYCSECPMNDFANDKCELSGKYTKYNSKPKENDCPLVAISKTETTSCEWCKGGIDTASLMGADMMMRFVRPVNYCPNCGRKLKGE